MKTLQQICVCALLTALTGLVVCAMVLVRTATGTLAAIPRQMDATRAALVGEIATARHDVIHQVADSRHDLLMRTERQAAALREGVLTEAGRIRQTADRRVGDTLARADTALSTAQDLRQDLKPVIAAAQDTLEHTEKTVVDLHPQLLGLIAASKVTAGETAQAMRDFRGAVPGFLTQSQAIAGNVQTATLRFSGVADNLNRLTKPKWYDRLIGYGLNGVILYRNLNPITSLTVKAAQILTSRP
jgi:ABC-type transporter Mla subunit MlaD